MGYYPDLKYLKTSFQNCQSKEFYVLSKTENLRRMEPHPIWNNDPANLHTIKHTPIISLADNQRCRIPKPPNLIAQGNQFQST